MKLRSRILFLFAFVCVGIMVARVTPVGAQVASSAKLTGALLWKNTNQLDGPPSETYFEADMG
jgi:hypothetical protein